MSNALTRDEINRRKLLALMGVAVGAALLPPEAVAQQKAALKAIEPKPGPGRAFVTADEFALLDEFAETLIPADERSGGARAAKVAEYLDARVGESVDPDFRKGWREDVAEIDRMATAVTGRRFVATRPQERARLMNLIARNERNPKTTGESSFGAMKWQIAYVYYKTRIGIHDELKYAGNQILDQFEGFEPWKQ